MRKTSAKLILLVGLLLGAASIARAGQPISVAVKVDVDDADLRERLASAVRNELRIFKDVTVVTKGPRQFEILVTAVGHPSAFAAGFSAVEWGFGLVASRGGDATDLPVLCYGPVVVLGGGAHFLHEAIVGSVASFDSKCFEPFRQAQTKKRQ